MRFATNNGERSALEGNGRVNSKRPDASHRAADLIPLYDHDQFLFLVERERARADRAAARPPKAPRKRPAAPQVTAQPAAGSSAPDKAAAAASKGQPKPSSEGVWGATTDNREFSLVIFRPRARTDRPGLVQLLQDCVRTTDAVGIIDTRRLGVLLPDTAANNALHFVKKVLALADEQGVHLSHIVHTYPAAWPDEESPLWNEPRRAREDAREDESGNGPDGMQPDEQIARRSAQKMLKPVANRVARGGIVRGLVNWLQFATAGRRPARRAARA